MPRCGIVIRDLGGRKLQPRRRLLEAAIAMDGPQRGRHTGMPTTKYLVALARFTISRSPFILTIPQKKKNGILGFVGVVIEAYPGR